MRFFLDGEKVVRYERDADDFAESDYEERVGTKTKGVRLKNSVAIVLREPFDGSEFEGISEEEGQEVWELIELLGGLTDASEMSWLEIREEFYDAFEMLNDAKEEFGTNNTVEDLYRKMFEER